MLKKLLHYIGKILLALFLLSLLTVVVYRFVFPPITPLMVIRACSSDSDKGWDYAYKKVPLEDISQNMILAVMGGEDDEFMQHHGFNFKQIKMAYEEQKSGRRFRGGSTISQQCAKNVFLSPRQSYLRKGLEAYFTVMIEFVWGKKRIMEVYLNVIEFGDGIYGVEAASQHYFHKSAKKLTRNEAARLAAVLPSPRKRNPLQNTSYMIRQTKHIQWMMGCIGHVDFK